MSRLLIKNIPVNATPESLRAHLLSTKHNAPIITDVRVAHKRDGTSRRFAFVGFKTDDQAHAAKEWFHGTYWGSQKLSVEVVQGVKDAPAPRPNKRPRLLEPERASAPTKPKPKVDAKNPDATEDDSLRAEFISLMNPRNKKGPAWADGAHSKAMATATPRTLPPSDIPHRSDVEEQDAIARDDTVSDLEWMKSRMTTAIREGRDFEQSDDEDEKNATSEDEPKQPVEVSFESTDPQEITRQTILTTARLFVRNLTFSCTTEELQELFGRFGQIEQVHIPLTSEHTSKGLAFVSYVQAADAVSAWQTLDGTTFQGRLLHILAGIERRKDAAETGESKKKSFKEDMGDKRKREAGKEFNWGMLYMNSDAVVSSIADRMHIPKADILGATESEGASSQNPAVKLALAETHIIQETKRYFEDQGVVLGSLSARSAPRSRTTILVKNIPYGTTTETLRGLFEPHGGISRLLIPPSGTLAVVEYTHAEEAAHAFRAIAYRRLGNSVVYLEWAPEGMLVEGSGRRRECAVVKPVTIREQDDGVSEEPVSIRSGSTLFVKNLSFATTTERLAQVFRNMPSFLFARVQMKPAPPNHKARSQPEQEKLSMGYGFVGFSDVDAAKKALKTMQGFVLDGHKLHVTFAGRGADEEEKKDGGVAKAKTPKMIVKNVPFEATKKDIRDLFGVYGTLKSVRLPRKFDTRTRGFAFLEFVSRHEAENAFAALRHTHLLGRHLVLDWAAEGEQDIDVLRRKVGVGFGAGNDLPGRKRKLDIAMDGADEEDI
ncbi:RNA-binding domain-containing protein [Ramaria rubella]|nr:RNA-binding domain-containing protein [Ramaria rubella]